ncbi:MAG: 23S rRNA (pseudouridine(1915)-N(3))-methyltransferase RlmH [Chitinophagaceae bacterium]
MKIQCWSIGKANEQYVKTGVEDFTKRISHYFPVEWAIISPPKQAAGNGISETQRKEGELILNLVKKEDCLVVLDERGKQLNSEGLAGFIQLKANESVKQLVFLIGGAYGLDETVIKRANFQWSLSPLVFPHQLVRLILAEQIYRACTIIRNEKYHHS